MATNATITGTDTVGTFSLCFCPLYLLKYETLKVSRKLAYKKKEQPVGTKEVPVT
jgi:hypothetical protein